MGLYMDRVPCSDPEKVECNRCGGKHFVKDTRTGRRCKNRPTLAKEKKKEALRVLAPAAAEEDAAVFPAVEAPHSLDSIFQEALREVDLSQARFLPFPGSVQDAPSPAASGPQDAQMALLWPRWPSW